MHALRHCSNNTSFTLHVCVCVFAHTSLPPELHGDEWVPQRPSEGADDPAQCQETPAREDDSDTDLTYGEVEQRLDLLQQHLNRWGVGWGWGGKRVERT